MAHILASHSSNEPVLRGHLALYRELIFGESPLSHSGTGSAVAVAVPATNNCHYCTVHHSEALAMASDDRAMAQLVIDGKFDDLGPRLAMCGYAVELTRHPQRTSEDMLTPMRAAGLTERELIDVNQVIAYVNYVNRVAQGLGVELEATWPDDVRERRAYRLGADVDTTA